MKLAADWKEKIAKLFARPAVPVGMVVLAGLILGLGGDPEPTDPGAGGAGAESAGAKGGHGGESTGPVHGDDAAGP